ncbi:NUDIX domain-containing protein [Chryseobacterium wanjuense]
MTKSAGLLIIKNSKVLLVKPRHMASDNNWSIPKGLIDKSSDRNIIETAIRETFEETGILIPKDKIDPSKRSLISYVDSKGILSKIIFYFVVEISDKEYNQYKISNDFDSSEIETIAFFSAREARKRIYWKQQSVLNFVKPDSFCINELELLIKLGYIYKVKHPVFPIWLYNITKKCKVHKNWDYTTLSCRGLILDDSGKILARPFKKFFERNEMYPEILDILSKPICIADKLDGALGVMYKYKNSYYICSKNNFNHYVGILATDALYNQLHHLNIKDWKGHTTLFEIITFKTPFTINYTVEDTVIPIAVINNKSAKNDFTKLEELKNVDIKGTIREGFIDNYRDGTMIKNKLPEFINEYMKLKKLKEINFFNNSDKITGSLLDRKKIMDHNFNNLLTNFTNFFFRKMKNLAKS